MNYCCFFKKDQLSEQIRDYVINVLNGQGWTYTQQDPTIIITIGGDGTVLAAVQHYLWLLDKVYFIGIHTGSLGFFNDYQVDEVNQLLQDLIQKQPTVDKKRMLRASIADQTFYGLNEIRVENNLRTLILEVRVDDLLFETYRGAGLCMSSQAGSTAYNRSINGAILDDQLQLWQLSEIIPIHNMHYRSLGTSIVLNPNRVINVSSNDFSDSVLAYDHLYAKITSGQNIICSLSEKYVNFAHYRNISHFKRLQTLF